MEEECQINSAAATTASMIDKEPKEKEEKGEEKVDIAPSSPPTTAIRTNTNSLDDEIMVVAVVTGKETTKHTHNGDDDYHEKSKEDDCLANKKEINATNQEGEKREKEEGGVVINIGDTISNGDENELESTKEEVESKPTPIISNSNVIFNGDITDGNEGNALNTQDSESNHDTSCINVILKDEERKDISNIHYPQEESSTIQNKTDMTENISAVVDDDVDEDDDDDEQKKQMKIQPHNGTITAHGEDSADIEIIEETPKKSNVNNYNHHHHHRQQQQPQNLLNKFASWKSKAETAIQKSEVLKAAQKNIIDKKNEMEKVVGMNFTPNRFQKTNTTTATTPAVAVKREKELLSVSISQIINVEQKDNIDDNVNSEPNGDGFSDNTGIINDDVKIIDNERDDDNDDGDDDDDDDDDDVDNIMVVEGDDQSKKSRLTLDEDEFSYDSQGRRYDSDSEESSIYVDEDDAFSMYSSDQSSIRIQSSHRRRNNSAGSKTSSPNGRQRSPRQLFRDDGTSTAGTRQVNDVTASMSKGRYAHKSVDGPAILKRLRKVRAPSPPSIPASSSSSSFITLNSKPPNQQDSLQDAKEKQIARIKRSFVGPQLDALISNLSQGEYLMFLGPGMLGVNLKQTFLKGHGVYIDMIMPRGNAHKSGVVWIGDRLVKVGNVDVSKGTIYDVPSTIANMKRPVIMILNSEHETEWEKMDYINVAVGMINKIQEESKQDLSDFPTVVKENDNSLKTGILPSLSPEIRKAVHSYASKRSNEISSFSAISFACKNNQYIQLILLEALMTCCIDNRRLPFLAAFIASEDSFLANTDDIYQDNDIMITGSTKLMLLLEIISFRDLFGITPMHKRLLAAKRIAYKFLIPQAQEVSVASLNPQFDMRPMFAVDLIMNLEKAINDGDIQYNLFYEVEDLVKKSFGGMKFASFLLSDECARMRAYMRGTSPYRDIVLQHLFKESLEPKSSSYVSARNHLEFIVVYLLCQSENDVLDKNYHTKIEENKDSGNNRVMGAAGGICCTVFIDRLLIPVTNRAKMLLLQNNISDQVGKSLLHSYSLFWECFISPSGGTLSCTPLSNDVQVMLDKVRRSVLLAASPPRNFSKEEKQRHIIRSLALNTELSKSLLLLGEELKYDYASNSHPKYRGHTFHEWMCNEINTLEENCPIATKQSDNKEKNTEREPNQIESTPSLPSGCISRLLRRLDFPVGLSRHCPEVHHTFKVPIKSEKMTLQEGQKIDVVGSPDFAIIFGDNYDTNNNTNIESVGGFPQDMSLKEGSLCRFASFPISNRGKDASNKVDMDTLIPPTLESYITTPLLGDLQFKHIIDSERLTLDNWEVSLTNFIFPYSSNNEDNGIVEDGFLYGVSLVMNFNIEKELSDKTEINFVEDTNQRMTWVQEKDTMPKKLSIFVDANIESFNDLVDQKSLSSLIHKLQNERSTESSSSTKPVSVGMALLSYENVIPSMRKSLSRFFSDISRVNPSISTQAVATPLANILKCFHSKEADASVLSSLLKPYVDYGISSFSKSSQKEMFEKSSIETLVESIPPIPLVLLFITALLEQKIIFTSRRRSSLVSMTIALKKLLNPFEWSHLFVPLVPAGMAVDLIQYPAPFILGIPFGSGTMSFLKTIPDDVTIVDVDVGRVILAKNFSSAHIESNSKNPNVGAPLRSQVLHLAETLGGVIGATQSECLWKCDSPLVDSIPAISTTGTKGEAVESIFKSFIKELLAGYNSCCFWLEEEMPLTGPAGNGGKGVENKECNILFDEDRFFHLKRLRHSGTYGPLFHEDYFENSDDDEYPRLDVNSSFALSLDHFNIIIETFLRGQLLSVYLSSRRKQTMSFW